MEHFLKVLAICFAMLFVYLVIAALFLPLYEIYRVRYAGRRKLMVWRGFKTVLTLAWYLMAAIGLFELVERI